jgi:hypothetical protein
MSSRRLLAWSTWSESRDESVTNSYSTCPTFLLNHLVTCFPFYKYTFHISRSSFTVSLSPRIALPAYLYSSIIHSTQKPYMVPHPLSVLKSYSIARHLDISSVTALVISLSIYRITFLGSRSSRHTWDMVICCICNEPVISTVWRRQQASRSISFS